MSDRNVLIIMMCLFGFGIFGVFMCQQCGENETCAGWCYPVISAFCSFVVLFSVGYLGSFVYFHLKDRCSNGYLPVSITIMNQPLIVRDGVDTSSDDELTDDPAQQLVPTVEI